MSAQPVVRRVRVEEWRQIRDLRIEAVSDPDAGIAFLSTLVDERARDDDFWRHRAAGGALGDDGAQFIADVDGCWIGTASVLVRAADSIDHHGDRVPDRRADVVGVYVSPRYRGTGVLGQLLDTAAAWSADRGIADLTLSTHVDNQRAQAAYRKAGFVPTGETFTSTIGPEIGLRREGSTRP